tara:strand:- start:349 stop:531 length:183 start_codon:yes stop_codon:yes gene_type:complete
VEVNSELSIAEIPSHGGYDSWMLTDDNKNSKKKRQEPEVVKVLKKNETMKKPSYIEVLKK